MVGIRLLLAVFSLTVNILIITDGYSQTQSLSLDEALRLSRENAPESLVYEKQAQALMAEAKQVYQALDGQMAASWQTSQDDGSLNFASRGEKRVEDNFQASYRKSFLTGSFLEVSSSWRRQTIKFPFPLDGVDPFNAPKYNPENQSLLGVTFRQSLWRNWRSKELRLSESVLENLAIEPRYRAELESQDIQSQTEQLYWQLAGVDAQISIAQKLIATNETFANSMRQRAKLGRSDDVDVAEAESMLISREADLLELQILRDQIKSRLKVRLWGPESSKQIRIAQSLSTIRANPANVTQLSQAIELASKQRLDLRMIERQIQASQGQVFLEKEKNRPDLGVFISHFKRGLGDKVGNSAENLGAGDITSVGIDISWPLGSSKLDSTTQAAQLRQESLRAQQSSLIRVVAQNLEVAFERLQGASRQKALANNQLSSIDGKKRAEQKKLNQARSDDVAVLRYEMEKLNAQILLIDADLNLKLAQADIRALIHGYPYR